MPHTNRKRTYKMKAQAELLNNAREIESAHAMNIPPPEPEIIYGEFVFDINDIARACILKNGRIIGLYFRDGDQWNIKFDQDTWNVLQNKIG